MVGIQLKDQLPCGRSSNPSKDVMHNTDNFPSTNVIYECDFVSYDKLSMKPTLTAAGILIFNRNKKCEWLKEKQKMNLRAS